MLAVTIKKARASLNKLVEQARRGEQVVLMRGSEHVAAIIPISSDDLRLDAPIRLSDEQAQKYLAYVERERPSGRAHTFSSPESAVTFLQERSKRRRRI